MIDQPPPSQEPVTDPNVISQSEQADVSRWTKRIQDARKFDEPARQQYAKDRKQARGDSGFEVDANLMGNYIEITEAFTYARDPDVDVFPAKSTEPPDLLAIKDAAESSSPMAMLDPMAMQMQQQATAQQVQEMRKRYRQRQRNNRDFAETLELVIAQLWKNAGLKKRARKMVRSALTVGPGWLKASWQERTAPCPETLQQINDLQDNLKRAQSLKQQAQEASGPEQDAMLADLQRQIETLQGQTERVIARGFVVDFVRAEDMQVAPGVDLSDYVDAPWIANRIPMTLEDAMADFRLTKEQLSSATRYYARKPEMMQNVSPMVSERVNEDDADAFVSHSGDGSADCYVMVWEIWDRDSNSVLTTMEGLKRWIKPVWQPCATTRFYPFFLLPLSDVDGQRHPQSLVSRSAKLVDEYNRIGSAEAEHRRRIKPKTAFNAGALSAEEANKLATATTQEMVGIKSTNPTQSMADLLYPVAYAPLDPMLYDRNRIVNELERLWGIQEALSGTIQTAKTATEAEIQQTGFNARSNSRRDLIEDVLSDLARYTGEVAWCYMKIEDVTLIAGPDAMWPEYQGAESLSAMVSIQIRAGSTGKPNTKSEREAWSTLLPMLQQGVMQIAQFRGTPLPEIADAMERLLRETAQRSGERLDIDTLIPQATASMPMLAPPGAPNGPAGQPADPALGLDPAGGGIDPAGILAGLAA